MVSFIVVLDDDVEVEDENDIVESIEVEDTTEDFMISFDDEPLTEYPRDLGRYTNYDGLDLNKIHQVGMKAFRNKEENDG
jgi:hypothetical protein